MGIDDFRAQLATAAKLNQEIGERIVINKILQWAVENHDALCDADLSESLMKALNQ
jgi:hypothetical protein